MHLLFSFSPEFNTEQSQGDYYYNTSNSYCNLLWFGLKSGVKTKNFTVNGYTKPGINVICKYHLSLVLSAFIRIRNCFEKPKSKLNYAVSMINLTTDALVYALWSALTQEWFNFPIKSIKIIKSG